MREIKFRALNNDKKYMEYDVDINSDGQVIEYNYGYYAGSYDYPIMQYTGLKDKNGREIYEGDILEIKHLMGCETGELIFKYGAFLFDDGGYSYLGDHLANSEYIKVIGNIYENPELLEGEK